jgi:hypothetical protein
VNGGFTPSQLGRQLCGNEARTATGSLCDKCLARLKSGVTLAALQAGADAQTDLAAAQ